MEKPQVNHQEVIAKLFNIIGMKQVHLEELQGLCNALKAELEKYTTNNKEV